MTATAALAKALLDGRTINIKNCFEMIGLTNAPREVSRMIEQKFGVKCTRIQRDGRSRYGQACTWIDYRLPQTQENLEGIQKMREYVYAQIGGNNPKTTKELKQAQLF